MTTPTLTIGEKGGFECDGNGKCGATDFYSIENVKKCFGCEYCPTFIRNKHKHKIIDKRIKFS